MHNLIMVDWLVFVNILMMFLKVLVMAMVVGLVSGKLDVFDISRCMCLIYIYICVCVCVCIYMCVYIYIYQIWATVEGKASFPLMFTYQDFSTQETL